MKLKRSILIILLVMLFTFAFGVSVFGYENGIYKRNVSAISDRMSALEVMMNENSKADLTPDKSVAIRINSVIVKYVGKINELRADARIAGEDLVPEIDALYLRGRIAGGCASLYERGSLLVDGDGADKLLKLYEESVKSVDGISDVTALYRAERELLAKMRETLYSDRIDSLLISGDSESCYELAAKGIEDIKWASSAFAEEAEYEKIYQKVKKEIEAWRVVETERNKLTEHKEKLGAISYLPRVEKDKLIKESEALLNALSEKLLKTEKNEWDKLSLRYEADLGGILARAEVSAVESAKSQYKELCEKKNNDVSLLIASLFYLDKNAVEDIKRSANDSLSAAIVNIEKSEKASDTEAAYCDYIAVCVKLIENIEEQELSAASGGLSSKASEGAKKAIKEIEAHSRIDDGEKQAYVKKINDELLAVCARIDGLDSISSIEMEYETFSDYVCRILNDADDIALSRVANDALDELRALYESFDKDEFQKESYAALGEIYDRIRGDILKSSNTESIEKLIEDAKMEMTGVILRSSRTDTPDLTDTKRTSVIDWLLVVFGGLAIIEAACALCIAYYRQRKKEAPLLLGVYPVNILLGVSGALGPILALITLILVDLALGVYIYFGLREILKARKRSEVYYPTNESDEARDMISEGNERGFYLSDVKRAELMPEKLDSVSVEEADMMMNDEKAELLIIRSEESLPMVRERKKGFVNVDTISDNFEAGDTVTLDNLKEKGLIPKSAVYVKVLARGRIDKPLCVKAQGFSASAVKMIALTGGTAVLVERKR